MDIAPKPETRPRTLARRFGGAEGDAFHDVGGFAGLLPREDHFLRDLFQRHAEVLVAVAGGTAAALGGRHIEARGKEINGAGGERRRDCRRGAARGQRSFIRPSTAATSQDLIQSMDDAIDMMRKTVKTVTLFEPTSSAVDAGDGRGHRRGGES